MLIAIGALANAIFRGLWIQRINAAVRTHGLTYSVFMGALLKTDIAINRKMLSELAIHQPEEFSAIVAEVKKQLK